MIYDWPRRAHWWLAGNEKFTAAPIAVRRRALMYRCVKETCDSRIDAPRRLGRCVEHWLERSFFWRGAMTRGKHVNAFQCFVLPYEPEYTAHRDDERACRVTKLHLKAREYVQGPAIAPELLDIEDADPAHDLPRLGSARGGWALHYTAAPEPERVPSKLR